MSAGFNALGGCLWVLPSPFQAGLSAVRGMASSRTGGLPATSLGGGIVAPGLWRLRKTGYEVYTAEDLRKTGYPGTAGGEIYAVFEVEEDPVWADQTWSGEQVLDTIEAYESSVRHRMVHNLGRTSPYPRVLPLRDLLKARA